MNTAKRILAWSLSLLLLLGVLSRTVWTAKAAGSNVISAETFSVPEVPLPESKALYEGYVEGLFYPATSLSFLGETARDRLDLLGQCLYDFLKSNLLAVSSGTLSSTVFTLSSDQILAWGGTVSHALNETQTPQEAAAAALQSFKEEFDSENVLYALLHDCPYELYWYDKVTGVTESGKFVITANSCNIQAIEFRFSVVADMQAENYSSISPTFDTSNIAAATVAANTAQNLVDRFADRADYAKLLAYRDEICSLVSYDKAAASGGNFSADDDPWQLISVFDGNSTTNVVCEGYAKAFQYLFDLSEFSSEISCITVSGTMSGEGHMWNIVTVGGQHYLTDITNSDTGTSGANGSLFLAGASGSIQNGYTANKLRYIYNASTLTLWGSGASSALNIAPERFIPCAAAHTAVIVPAIAASCTEPGLTEGVYCAICGQTLTLQQTVPATGHNWTKATCAAPKTCLTCNRQEGTTLPHTYRDEWDTTCEDCGHIRTLDITLSPMYRLYNPYTQEHLLTSNEAEKNQLVSIGWHFDGVAWKTPSKGNPVYRLYNPFDDWHTYTMSQAEIDMLVPLGWKVDGVICYSAVGNTNTPIYRLFNPYAQINYHLLTASEAESSWLVTLGWVLEGVGWYGIR